MPLASDPCDEPEEQVSSIASMDMEIHDAGAMIEAMGAIVEENPDCFEPGFRAQLDVLVRSASS